MKIEFQTEELRAVDRLVLQSLDGERTVLLRQQEEMIIRLQQENASLQQQIVELERAKLSVPVVPVVERRSRKLRDWIKDLFDENTVLSAREVFDKLALPLEQEKSCYMSCYYLVKTGYLDRTLGKHPTKFFLKSSGNPELREHLPKGTKMNHMG